MLKSTLNLTLIAALTFGGATVSYGQKAQPSAKEQEAQYIAVLKSNAPLKDKVDACRELGHVGTKAAVAPLAALLADKKLSHMARYGLEPIPDPAVDEALRAAVCTLKGRQLAGVIVSIGARRDCKAVALLAAKLKDPNPIVVQATARALGKIGTIECAKALGEAYPTTPAANRPAFYEGALRCAEALAASGKCESALKIYDKVAQSEVPAYVRKGAAKAAACLRKK